MQGVVINTGFKMCILLVDDDNDDSSIRGNKYAKSVNDCMPYYNAMIHVETPIE